MIGEEDDKYERESLPMLHEAGIPYEELSGQKIAKRWPQINVEGVRWAIHETASGFLSARVACQAVVEGFVSEGGEYKQAAVLPDELSKFDGGRTSLPAAGLSLSDGSRLTADQYVFACGPWLGKLFPQTIGSRIRPTKQDVFSFGTPPGDDRFSAHKLPVWADNGGHFVYGIPATDERGLKVADDTRGPEFDPTSGERIANPDGLKRARDYLAFRFPAMKDASLVETRVCQYENTPDNNFIADRHPAAENVWLVGGGSGHGFKHGPALGEMVAELVINDKDADLLFRIARFETSNRER